MCFKSCDKDKCLSKQKTTRKNLSCKYFLPTQLVPFPSYPLKHVQLKDPTVLLQTAHGLQLCTFVLHSLISTKKEISIYDYIALKPNLKKQTNKQRKKTS